MATGSTERFAQYRADPVGFCIDVLGMSRDTLVWGELAGYATHAWDGTVEPLVTMLEGLAEWKDVGVEAGTGTGKSYTAAAVVLWFLCCWEGARVFTFAPKEDQLRLFIWTEMTKLFPAILPFFPAAEMTDLCLRMSGGTDDSWCARGYAVAVKAGQNIATHAAGMHSEHMLLIYEETPGIHPAVIAAGENTCTAPHNIRLFLGNPDHQLDTLHLACVSPGVVHVRISALDHPNLVTGRTIVPGAASKKSVMRRLAKYGAEGTLYLSRVRGISPAQAADALIQLLWIERSNARWAIAKAYPSFGLEGTPALGVDVANSEDGDEGAIARGRGRVLKEVISFPCPNANDLGMRVVEEMIADEIDGSHVGIDSVGVGAGCVNECRRREKYVKALNGGEMADEAGDAERFNNKRSQMHWALREDLRLDRVDLEPSLELSQDLTTPQWRPVNGRIVVESKEDLKRRLPEGRSPNKGDAVVYWNWVRERDVLVTEKRSGSTILQMLRDEMEALDQVAAPAVDYVVLRQG